jgi:ribonuclease BN (tRNA processing enzyme)
VIAWTVLGSGTHLASARRASPGHLAVAGERRFLFDCGPGTFHALARAGSAPERIDACFVTHLHPDHVSDLVPLLFRLRNLAKEKGEDRGFTVVGPPGFGAFVRSLRLAHAPFLETENFRLAVREGEAGVERFGDAAIRSAPVAHGLAALAYRIDFGEGGSAVYSGDTGRSAELVRLARGASLLVIEAALSEGSEDPFHLTPSGAARIASEAGVGAMLLVHLDPEGDDADRAASCRDFFAGKVILAEDLLTLRVEGGEVR